MDTLPPYHVHPQGSALHMAVSANNILEVKRLLAGGADVNFCAKDICTPLRLAVDTESIEIAKMLLEHGANPNLTSDAESNLQVSVFSENVEMVKMLLDYGANADGQIIILAVLKSSLDILKVLLEKGADPNYGPPFRNSPLHVALTRSSSPDTQIGIVKALIDAGADVNNANVMGQTALHLATSADIVVYLLESGAQINAQDRNGQTPLHLTVGNIAEMHEKKNVIEPLLLYGADVNIPDAYGQTFMKMCTEIKSLSCDVDVTMTKLRMLKIKSHLSKRFPVTNRKSEQIIAELDSIKKTNVEGICLYNVFEQSLKDLVFCNDSTFRKIILGDDLKKMFPHFYLLLRLTFREAEGKYFLRQLSETFSYKLSEALQLNVPTDVSYLIIGYFMDQRDINNLKLALQ